MKKLSELSNDTLLCVEVDEFYVMPKEEYMISSFYLDRQSVDNEDIKVFLAKPVYATFDLRYALESLEDEMYEDWLDDVLSDISHEEIESIENSINKILHGRPSYSSGEKIDVFS